MTAIDSKLQELHRQLLDAKGEQRERIRNAIIVLELHKAEAEHRWYS